MRPPTSGTPAASLFLPMVSSATPTTVKAMVRRAAVGSTTRKSMARRHFHQHYEQRKEGGGS